MLNQTQKESPKPKLAKWKGGVIVGWGFHSEFPLAKLIVNYDEIVIEFPFDKLLYGGPVRFKPEEINHISHLPFVPLVYEAIQIHHTVLKYPSFIVFLCFKWKLREIIGVFKKYHSGIEIK